MLLLSYLPAVRLRLFFRCLRSLGLIDDFLLVDHLSHVHVWVATDLLSSDFLVDGGYFPVAASVRACSFDDFCVYFL